MTVQRQQQAEALIQDIVNQAEDWVAQIALISGSLREYNAEGNRMRATRLDDDQVEMLRLYLPDDNKKPIALFMRKDKIAKVLDDATQSN